MFNLSIGKIVGALIIVAVLIAAWFFDLGQYTSLTFLQAQVVHLNVYVAACYWCVLVYYMLAYTAMVACMIPGVGPATLVGGFLFGAVVGTLAAMSALTLGITISFLVIRYLFASLFPKSLQKRRDAFAARIKKYGAWYIFILNVITVVPFAIINTLAALSDIPVGKFILASMLGSLPMIVLYACAGKQIASISSLSQLFSPLFIGVLCVIALLSCIPFLVKRFTNVTIDDV